MSARGWTWPRTANVRGTLTDPSAGMSDPAAKPASPASPMRSVRQSCMFAGRATRSELIAYLFATLLISVPVSFVTGLTLTHGAHLLTANVLTVLLALPLPALLVRRLNDSGRRGAWVWLAVFGFAVWLARTLISARYGLSGRLDFDRWTWLLDWGLILANLVSVLLALLPGSKGANRFGPNPRLRA